MCGERRRFDPAEGLNWRMITLDGQPRFYACPNEFPPDHDRNPRALSAACDTVMAAVVRKLIAAHVALVAKHERN